MAWSLSASCFRIADIMSCLRRGDAFSICSSSAKFNNSAGVLVLSSWRFMRGLSLWGAESRRAGVHREWRSVLAGNRWFGFYGFFVCEGRRRATEGTSHLSKLGRQVKWQSRASERPDHDHDDNDDEEERWYFV